MAAANINIYEQVYNVKEDATIPQRVALVICVLVQRGLLVGGFSSDKELLTLHYTGYNKNKPVWQVTFFEQLFTQEPLLAVRDKVKGVFVCSNRNLIVPDALYEEKEARNWLRHIHYIEHKDVVESYRLEEDQANYLHAIPLGISELIKINFKKAATMPLAMYQFGNKSKKDLYLQCCITSEEVCATLHKDSQLLWHRVFHYTCAEDIAYTIGQFCMENNIPSAGLALRCNALSGTEAEVISKLSQYFPALLGGNGQPVNTRWDAAIYLSQQLLACVS